MIDPTKDQPAAADDQGWTDQSDPIVSMLSEHRPAAPAPRAAFQSEQRRQFVSAHAANAGGISQWWSRALEAISTRRVIVWPAAAIAVVLGLVFVAPRFGIDPSAPLEAPAPVTRAELMERNDVAWLDIEDVTGWFETADGRRWEEWVQFADDGTTRYRRFIDGPSTEDTITSQWNISDGMTEWVVDGESGQMVRSFAQPESIPDGLQCSMLRLPMLTAEGAQPTAGRLDDRQVYRLEGTLGDSLRVFWVDARDMLVYRVDDADGKTLWRRGDVTINDGLPIESFERTNLERL